MSDTELFGGTLIIFGRNSSKSFQTMTITLQDKEIKVADSMTQLIRGMTGLNWQAAPECSFIPVMVKIGAGQLGCYVVPCIMHGICGGNLQHKCGLCNYSHMI